MDKLNGSSNGHLDFHVFSNQQEQRFGSLEMVLKQGFEGVTQELKALREQGYIPVSVVEKISEQQKAIIHPVIKLLCYSLILVILWFTGLKAALPHLFPGQ
jgi:hypothetical protein